jgi:hypothetical protein
MKLLLRLFPAFALAHAVPPFNGRVAAARVDGLLDCIALPTIAVASRSNSGRPSSRKRSGAPGT